MARIAGNSTPTSMPVSNPVPVSTPSADGVGEMPMVSDRVKQDWNKFLTWLDEKKLRGKPELDKGGLGQKMLEEYLSVTKDTTLNKDIIPAIRKEYMNLRQSNIEDVISGKANWNGKSGKDLDFSTFMRHIVENEKTSNPNYVGQHLTQTFFPAAQRTLPSGETIKLKVYSPKSKVELFNK